MLTDRLFMFSYENGKFSRICISDWMDCILMLPCGVLHCLHLLTPWQDLSFSLKQSSSTLCVCKSPGRLVKTQIAGPQQCLVRKVWGEAWECVFLICRYF